MVGRGWRAKGLGLRFLALACCFCPGSEAFTASQPLSHSAAHLLSSTVNAKHHRFTSFAVPQPLSPFVPQPLASVNAKLAHYKAKAFGATILRQSGFAADGANWQSDSFQVRQADDDEVRQLSELVVGAFVKDEEELGKRISKFMLWFNVYLGMVDRLFTSNFVKGMSSALEPGAPDGGEITWNSSNVDRSALHAIFTIEDAGGGHGGVVELSCGPCKLPLNLRAHNAEILPYISNLAVREDCRGRGFATALVKQCEQKALEWGFTEVFLDTDCSNQPALKLYHGNGYVAEMLDPVHNMHRKAYLRKRLGEDAPAHVPSALSIVGLMSRDTEGSEELVFQFDNSTMYMMPETGLQQAFGPFAQLISALGFILGILLF